MDRQYDSVNVPMSNAPWNQDVRQRLVFDTISDAVIVADGAGRVIDANRAATELLGYVRDDLLKRDVASLYHAGVDPAAGDQLCDIGGAAWSGELVMRRKDGSPVVVDARIAKTATPDGVLYVEALRDATERRAAEAEIVRLHRDLESRIAELERVLDLVPVGIGIAFDRECRYIKVNPYFARLLHVSPETNASLSAPRDERPTSFRILQDGRELAPEELPLQVAAARGVEVGEVVLDVVRADGSVVTLLEYAVPLFDEHGAVRGSVGAFVDITDRRRAEAERERLLQAEQAARAQAEAALRQRDEFIGLVSHDLKSPVTTVRGVAQLVQRRLGRGAAPTADSLVRDLDTIQAATHRMESMIDELSDIARLQTDQPVELRRSSVDLVALTRRVADEIGRSAERHAVQVHTNLPKLVGEWDAPRLSRVLANLIGNGVKYSPAGGPVTVSVTAESDSAGDWAVVTVQDRGVGIPAAETARVFDRYHRATNVVDRFAGAGIGLTGAKLIVEQHGGTIGLVSVEGEGTTVTVRLPRLPGAAAAPKGRGPFDGRW
ncbi:MAG: PAS domain-containing sensor histidine kinase [Dehalococcoidia bacterium]